MHNSALVEGSDVSAGKAGHRAGQAERLLHGFLEAVPDAVVVVDPDGTMVEVNAQTEKLFGYGREELLGRPVELLLPERSRARHVDHRRAYFAHPRTRPMDGRAGLFGRHKDGRELPVDVSLGPVPGGDRRLVAGAIRDMTEHRRLEEELRRRAADLEEADRRKDRFLATLAHELRSPLAAIDPAAEIPRRPDAPAEARERAVGVVRRQAGHMLRLVEDLLDLARFRRGEVALRAEPTNLAQVVGQAVEACRPLAEGRKQSLQAVLPPRPLRVRADPTRLVQVVSNLLTNASRYTPEGGHIGLSVTAEGRAAVLRVRDDGAGIPRGMLTRVFDLFTRLESGAKASPGGLGIGLALVRGLVEAHGGSVEAPQRGEGHGSEFVVRLPLIEGGP